MGGGREIEFKFLATASDIEAVLALEAFAPLRGAQPRLQTSTYFDTPDCELQKAGFILRLREAGGQYVQTVKSEGAGLTRGEWEVDLPSNAIDLDKAAETPLGRLLKDDELRARIGPVFTTSVRRRKAEISFTVARVEVAIDEGEVIAGDRRSPICEIELELKGGRRRGLFALARKLSRSAPVSLSLISKGEKGFRLAAGLWGMPVKMLAPKLDPELNAADAFMRIGYNCLRQVMLNAPAFESGQEVEAVHQTRVGIRRLRAALTLFRPLIDDPRYPKLKADLKWLSDYLGAARDIDVLLMETIEPAQENPMPGLAELTAMIRARQGEARADLRRAMASTRGRRLMVELVLWLEDGAWRHRRAADAPLVETETDPDGSHPVATEAQAPPDAAMPDLSLKDFLRDRLKSRRKKLAKMAAHLEDLPGGELHLVRIHAKKLRYQAAFFGSLTGGGRTHRRYSKFLDALEDIQEALGAIQDSEATAAFLEAQARAAGRGKGTTDPMVLFAAGRLAGAHPDKDELVKRAMGAVNDVLTMKPFWKKL